MTITVHFEVASAEELRDLLERLGHMASGVQALGAGRSANEPLTGEVEGREGLALYNDAELVLEVERRRTTNGQTELVPEQAAKGKPGRKPKLQAVAPTTATPTPADTGQDKVAANEPAPDPKAVAQAKPTEPSTDNPIAPETLTEADMLKLMQELYAESGDLTMVRGLAEEVCGKPQMSEVKPELYPQLKKRIEEELARVRTEKKAAGAA